MIVAVLAAWFYGSEFLKRDEVRTVTAILCGKEKDGQDRRIRTSEGDFRLGDGQERTAAQQYETLQAGRAYVIAYQGMEMPLLPRPVTRGASISCSSIARPGRMPAWTKR